MTHQTEAGRPVGRLDADVGPLHAELCRRAVRWLKKSAGCGVTISEMVSAAGETPDAIGWRSGMSLLIEAKVSRGDFLADRKKPWRLSPDTGMGDWRFFITPAGLLRPAEIPDGWGLLEVDGADVRRTHGVPKGNCGWGRAPFTGNKRAETILLCSALRRLDERANAKISGAGTASAGLPGYAPAHDGERK